MTIKLTSKCQAIDGGNGQPSACSAAFTSEGIQGNQKLLAGGIMTLCAVDTQADSYLWEMTANPPSCDYLLTGATQRMARLSLPGPGAYVVQLTVRKGDCTARSRSILWVASTCHLYRLPAASEALRFDGDPEWAGDLSKILQEADCNLPTAAQKAAMDKANLPSGNNPFATIRDLPGGSGDPTTLFSEDEVAAIHAGVEPSATNPFVTHSALPEPQLTPHQEAAIDAADAPTETNPFVTVSALPPPQLTNDEAAAIHAASNPTEGNPFITQSALPEPQLTPDQEAAIDAADAPTETNPLVTVSALPPPQLTDPEVAALHAANDPGLHNPVATLADLGQAGTVSRVVAAGTLDLSGATPSKTMGDLAVVSRDGEHGIATLTFATYQRSRAAYYVVKALPVAANARAGIVALTIVQFVEFTDQGFILQMVRPFATQKFALGPCMIEVSEILDEIAEVPGNGDENGNDDDVLLDEDFTDEAEGADPPNWLDTGPENSLDELDLFKTAVISGRMAFGTTDAGVNIHSHYVGPGAQEWTNYAFTGQMRLTDSRGGVGVTFLSQYPRADVYYRLRRWNATENTTFQNFHLAAHEHGERPVLGDAFSNVNPAAREDKPWYNFRIEVADTGQRTNIRAKVWPDDEVEPADFQMVAYEDDPEKRLTVGTVGIWSMRRGGKYVRNLKVVRLPADALENPPRTIQELVHDYYTLIQQEKFDDSWLMLSDRFKRVLSIETLDKYRREWQRSGAAFVLGIETTAESANSATLIVHLNYPKATAATADKRYRYEFERNTQTGHERFDHWLFVRGEEVT